MRNSEWIKRAFVGALFLTALTGGDIWFVNKYFGIEAHALLLRLWPPPTAEQIAVRRLHKIAGWFGHDCGHVPYHYDSDAAIACANAAMKTGQRFYVAFDWMGIDSYGTRGIAADSHGRIYEVTTDELGRGAIAAIATSGTVVNLSVTPCAAPIVERTSFPFNRYLSCETDLKSVN